MGRIGFDLAGAITLGLALLGGGVAAQEGPRDLGRTEAAAWAAVGRLDIDGKGFCTGSLIAPDLVLTAAHCLFDRETGAPVDPARLSFHAGQRAGAALATRRVARALPHPAYGFDVVAAAGASAADVALLRLDGAIEAVAPLPTGSGLAAGDRVDVLSYAQGREETPALEELCGVLGEESGVLVLSCEVDFGASGSPVLSLEGGEARIVSVVSAKGELNGRAVALGASLEAPLAELRAALESAEGGAVLARELRPGERLEGGALFIAVGGGLGG